MMEVRVKVKVLGMPAGEQEMEGRALEGRARAWPKNQECTRERPSRDECE